MSIPLIPTGATQPGYPLQAGVHQDITLGPRADLIQGVFVRNESPMICNLAGVNSNFQETLEPWGKLMILADGSSGKLSVDPFFGGVVQNAQSSLLYVTLYTVGEKLPLAGYGGGTARQAGNAAPNIVYESGGAGSGASLILTLPGKANMTTYIQGFIATSSIPSGTISNSLTVSISGVNPSLSFEFTESINDGGFMEIAFPKAIPAANGVNNPIQLTMGSGLGTHNAIMWGYYQ